MSCPGGGYPFLLLLFGRGGGKGGPLFCPPSLPPLPALFLTPWGYGICGSGNPSGYPSERMGFKSYALIIFRAPSPVAGCPGGTSNTMGTPCLRPCPMGLAGVEGFPQLISLQPIRHITPQASGPLGGWVLGSLPFPTGGFRDGLGPGLSRLPPLQVAYKTAC